MKRFIEGKHYMGRFVCNADHIVTVEVEKRTDKTVLVRETGRAGVREEKGKRRKIKEGRDSELITLGPGISIFADKELQ